LICPGLAITLVDYRKDILNPTITLAYEISNYPVKQGDKLQMVDIDGNELVEAVVVGVSELKKVHTVLVKVQVPAQFAKQVASFRVQAASVSAPLVESILPEHQPDDAMICLCERVTVGQVRKLIKGGITDLNQLKAITRAGMGPCGAKTCEVLIKGLLREEGIPVENVVPNTKRPVFIEVPLDRFPDGSRS
jgi:NAD(P)H-nitrite reductase large subunit